MVDDSSRVQMLAEALCTMTDKHHRTINNSKLHKPEEVINFWNCECLTCKEATATLIACGFEPQATTDGVVFRVHNPPPSPQRPLPPMRRGKQ